MADVLIECVSLIAYLVMLIVEAMRMCHVQDPKKRASAREVENFLKERIKQLSPGKLEEWGVL